MTISVPKLELSHSGFSHVGMRRTHNEDAFGIAPEYQLFIVADGMGGHNSGEIASKITTETIENFVRATLTDDEITWPYKYEKGLTDAENRLKTSIRLSNDKIWETSKRNDLYHGMGTTVVVAFFADGVVYIANVGDSRCYRLRNNQLSQISEDHSLLNDVLKTKNLTPEEIENFPHKNVIVRALGIRDHVEVDLFREMPQRGDVLLLCTDGLSDIVRDEEIAEILRSTTDPKLASKVLVRKANQNGGNDNITVVVVRVD